jgi:hypothetical protein
MSTVPACLELLYTDHLVWEGSATKAITSLKEFLVPRLERIEIVFLEAQGGFKPGPHDADALIEKMLSTLVDLTAYRTEKEIPIRQIALPANYLKNTELTKNIQSEIIDVARIGIDLGPPESWLMEYDCD